jgi:hypothetical protein
MAMPQLKKGKSCGKQEKKHQQERTNYNVRSHIYQQYGHANKQQLKKGKSCGKQEKKHQQERTNYNVRSHTSN